MHERGGEILFQSDQTSHSLTPANHVAKSMCIESVVLQINLT